MNNIALDSTVSSELTAVTTPDQGNDQPISLEIQHDALAYLVKARAQPASELSFDPQLESVVRAVYPYVNTDHDATMGLPFMGEGVSTAKVCPVKPDSKQAQGIYSCFNYHTIQFDWVEGVAEKYYTEPANSIRRTVYANSAAGLSDIVEQRDHTDLGLAFYSEPMVKYTATDRAAFPESIVSTNDMSSFVSQVNTTNQYFSAVYAGKFMQGLNYSTTLAEFTPWFNFFCNCMNLKAGLFGNYTNSGSHGLRDRIDHANVAVGARNTVTNLKVSHCTMGTFMSMVCMNALVPHNMDKFEHVVFVSRFGGQSPRSIAAQATLQMNWDQYYKFVRRTVTLYRPDGTVIPNNGLGLVHEAAFNRTAGDDHHILFVDLSDLRVTASAIGDMCIPTLQFPNNVHDLYSANWNPPNDLQRIGVALATFLSADDTNGHAITCHNALGLLYGCREAYDSAKYAACIAKGRDAAVLCRFVSNSTVAANSQWAPDITGAHRGAGPYTKRILAKSSLLTGTPLACSSYRTIADAYRRVGWLTLTVPAPDWAMQGAVATRFVMNPNASTIPRLGSTIRSLISTLSTTSAYISWWSDTMHELMHAGWNNYAEGDGIGITSLLYSIMKKSMLCGVEWTVSEYLPGGFFDLEDVNAYGLQFDQDDLERMPITKTPSTLFCSQSYSSSLLSLPHTSKLTDTAVFNPHLDELTYGEAGENLVSTLKGRMFFEIAGFPNISYESLGVARVLSTLLMSLFPLHYNWFMDQSAIVRTPITIDTRADKYQSILRDFIRLVDGRQYVVSATGLPNDLQSPFYFMVPSNALGAQKPKIATIGAGRDRVTAASLAALNL